MKKLVLATIAIVFVLICSFSFPTKKKNLDELNKENLWYVIKRLDIKHPEVVFAQALLESGNFTSKVCKIHNNLFGMKFPGKRETVAIGKSKSGYAKYSSWIESVEDYALYQDYIFLKKKKEFGKIEYFTYLDKTYAEGANYSIKLKRIIKENKNYIN
jgi:uncharacterized FlgJ-related protein